MAFNLNLRNARVSMNLTQSQVAKQLGISVSTYTKYETASNEPDLKMLIKLADFYHLSVDFLLRGYVSLNDSKSKNNCDLLLSEEEIALLTQYRSLDDVSKGRLLERLAVLLETTIEIQQNKIGSLFIRNFHITPRITNGNAAKNILKQ